MTKEKLKKGLSDLWGGFLIYALMPCLCMGMIFLLLFSNGIDAYSIECLAMEYTAKELTDRMVSEGVTAFAKVWEDNDESGAYFYAIPDSSIISDPVSGEDKLNVTLKLPEGMKPIIKKDLSSSSLFINTTDYTLDADQLREKSLISAPGGDEPLVLVLHTHGTEAFYDSGDNVTYIDPDGASDGYYDPNGESPRSDDITKNIVGVGAKFCEALEEMGIPALHCQTLHDKEDFSNSYTYSYQSAKAYLEKYPSIKYVIDIHRDSIVLSGGEKIKPYTTIESKPCAQVMLVMGTDESGYYHPDWRVNMGNALLYKDTMDGLYPTLSRSVYVREVRFNQHLSTGAMLLEVGSCGNTFEEAQNAAYYAGRALATLILSGE